MSGCNSCPLRKHKTGPIPATGSLSSAVFLLMEAPGLDELRHWKAGHSYYGGSVAVGKSGQELDQYLDLAGLARANCYVTNVVKCRPPDNRDPTEEEIACCAPLLADELSQSEAQVYGALGRFATITLLGPEHDMASVHGIPFWSPDARLVVPTFHPAYGLHDTKQMAFLQGDFQALADTLHGTLEPRIWGAYAQDGEYRLLRTPEEVQATLAHNPVLVAVDTETGEAGTIWSAQYATREGEAFMVLSEDPDAMSVLAAHLAQPHVTTLMHNALYDLPELASIGIHPAHSLDTMIMAYLLQTEPQGLKPLAFRYANLKMQEYSEVVAPAVQSKALAYITRVASRKWPPPDEILVWDKGVPRVKKPWPLERKAKRILADYAKSPDTVDLRARWHNIAPTEGRTMAEQEFGPMPIGCLADLPEVDAISYACRDADATLRVYPHLWAKIQAMSLEAPLLRDMRVVPLVARMQYAGMPVSIPRMEELGHYLDGRRTELEEAIHTLAGESVNPGSWQQVMALFRRLKLKDIPNTNSMVLRRHLGRHPIIPLLVEWRQVNKLRTAFVDALIARTVNGRVHPKIRITRVVTGRLSCTDPNLMAQPTRTKEGKMVRAGFVARPGCVISSNDYSQVEMRVTAHCAHDTTMIDLFQAGEDIHSHTAAKMFRIPLADVDEMAHRYPAKRTGFGILNQMTSAGLLREFQSQGAPGWTEPKCRAMIESWFNTYPAVWSWIKANQAHARRYGYVRDLGNRIRLIPELKSAHSWIRGDGERNAANGPIQMGAQTIIKEAMGLIYPVLPDLREGGRYVCEPLIQIHDDLVFEMSLEIVPYAIPIIQGLMEEAWELETGLQVDSKIGPTWGELKKWKP